MVLDSLFVWTLKHSLLLYGALSTYARACFLFGLRSSRSCLWRRHRFSRITSCAGRRATAVLSFPALCMDLFASLIVYGSIFSGLQKNGQAEKDTQCHALKCGISGTVATKRVKAARTAMSTGVTSSMVSMPLTCVRRPHSVCLCAEIARVSTPCHQARCFTRASRLIFS